LETWIKISENLKSFQDPTPTVHAQAAAKSLHQRGMGDGNVYSIVLLKTVRSELASASLETCKTWIRQGVYVFSLFTLTCKCISWQKKEPRRSQ
jgi:hypothetical protein